MSSQIFVQNSLLLTSFIFFVKGFAKTIYSIYERNPEFFIIFPKILLAKGEGVAFAEKRDLICFDKSNPR